MEIAHCTFSNCWFKFKRWKVFFSTKKMFYKFRHNENWFASQQKNQKIQINFLQALWNVKLKGKMRANHKFQKCLMVVNESKLASGSINWSTIDFEWISSIFFNVSIDCEGFQEIKEYNNTNLHHTPSHTISSINKIIKVYFFLYESPKKSFPLSYKCVNINCHCKSMRSTTETTLKTSVFRL